MGRTSKKSLKLSRRPSNHSLSSSKSTMNSTIKSQKSSRARKKIRQKVDETIKKLFKKLRAESQSQLDQQSSEISIIDLEDSNMHDATDKCNTSLTVPNIGPSTNVIIAGTSSDSYRSGNVPGMKTSRGILPLKPIVIKDDDPVITQKNVYTLHHSTPIKQKPSIDDVIPTVNNQLVKDDNNNKTKEINASSFLTIDLTMDSGLDKSTQPTIIDLDTTNEQQDCVVTSVSQGSSMSGDSEVTVLHRPSSKPSIATVIKTGLVNLNASDKDKILAFISENLLNGLSLPTKIEPRALATAEDTYIKEVILGKKLSHNSIGSNVYNPEKYVNTTGLRMVVIDGSNVAMAHGDHRFFSVRGLRIVIDFFTSRGHVVKAFVPKFRNKSGKSSDPGLLMQLERQGHVIFTPSREVQGRQITSYDDRYIIQCAAEFEGVIVSNDCFRDLIRENPRWESVINNRVLPYNWVNGMIMFPRDPLGRNGPTLERFLQMPKRKA